MVDSDSQLKKQILHVDDEETFRLQVKSILSSEGYEINTVGDGSSALNLLQSHTFDLILLDMSMPRMSGMEILEYVKEKYPSIEVIMLTAHNDVSMAVDCMKKGAFHYLTKPFGTTELLQVIDRAIEHSTLVRENSILQRELSRITHHSSLIGRSKVFVQTVELAEKVASTNTSVLLQGASGTGKDLFANLIYKKSPRSSGPLVTVNCASIPDTLIESEFFGHEKGAFTDARDQKIGLVELANRGTLFLDEVGDISMILQPKLLRFIQTGEFRRVGGTTTHHTNVRIISATNKNLHEEVKLGRFREDLLYRLNVVTITVPSLRDRKDDISSLAENILQKKLGNKGRKTLHPKALEALMNYDWPGNIRELENVLESSVILSNDEVIQPSDLRIPISTNIQPKEHQPYTNNNATSMSLKEMEQFHLSKVLDQTNWDKKAAAELLGISLKTLYTKISLYRLTPRQK